MEDHEAFLEDYEFNKKWEEKEKKEKEAFGVILSKAYIFVHNKRSIHRTLHRDVEKLWDAVQTLKQRYNDPPRT